MQENCSAEAGMDGEEGNVDNDDQPERRKMTMSSIPCVWLDSFGGEELRNDREAITCSVSLGDCGSAGATKRQRRRLRLYARERGR